MTDDHGLFLVRTLAGPDSPDKREDEGVPTGKGRRPCRSAFALHRQGSTLLPVRRGPPRARVLTVRAAVRPPLSLITETGRVGPPVQLRSGVRATWRPARARAAGSGHSPASVPSLSAPDAGLRGMGAPRLLGHRAARRPYGGSGGVHGPVLLVSRLNRGEAQPAGLVGGPLELPGVGRTRVDLVRRPVPTSPTSTARGQGSRPHRQGSSGRAWTARPPPAWPPAGRQRPRRGGVLAVPCTVTGRRRAMAIRGAGTTGVGCRARSRSAAARAAAACAA